MSIYHLFANGSLRSNFDSSILIKPLTETAAVYKVLDDFNDRASRILISDRNFPDTLTVKSLIWRVPFDLISRDLGLNSCMDDLYTKNDAMKHALSKVLNSKNQNDESFTGGLALEWISHFLPNYLGYQTTPQYFNRSLGGNKTYTDLGTETTNPLFQHQPLFLLTEVWSPESSYTWASKFEQVKRDIIGSMHLHGGRLMVFMLKGTSGAFFLWWQFSLKLPILG